MDLENLNEVAVGMEKIGSEELQKGKFRSTRDTVRWQKVVVQEGWNLR